MPSGPNRLPVTARDVIAQIWSLCSGVAVDVHVLYTDRPKLRGWFTRSSAGPLPAIELQPGQGDPLFVNASAQLTFTLDGLCFEVHCSATVDHARRLALAEPAVVFTRARRRAARWRVD